MHMNSLLSLSRTHAKLVALMLAGALVTPMLAGCGADTSSATSSDTDSAQASASASSDSSSSETSGETASNSDGADASSSSADAASASDSSSDSSSTDSTATDGSASASSDTSSSTQEAPTFDFSSALDDDGHWKDVTALDYVTLPNDYSSISIAATDVTPSDDDVQSQISSLTSNYATTEQVTDRAVEDGDTVNIDYVGSIDGVEFDGGSTEGKGTTVTIGVTNYIDDFLDQLVGHKPGETFDVNVTFPEDYGNDELNGKDAVFSVTINYIQETKQPDVTDDWVATNLKDTYGWSTVEEMEQGTRESLRSKNVSDYVQNYVLENSQVSEVPQSIIDYQGDLLVYQYEYYASMYNMDLASFLKMSAGVETTDDLVTNNQSQLENTAKSYLVFQAIAEDAGITVSDDELASYLKGVTGTDDIDSLESQYGHGYLMLQALVQKVGDYLTGNAQIDESTGDDASQDESSSNASNTADADTGSASSSSDTASGKSGESETEGSATADNGADENLSASDAASTPSKASSNTDNKTTDEAHDSKTTSASATDSSK